MATWSPRGLGNLRKQNRDTLDTEKVLYRNGVALPAQRMALRLTGQQSSEDGVAVSVPGVELQIRGDFTLDILAGDELTHVGKVWRVIEAGVATETNTSVAKRARAEVIGKASA